MRKSEKNAFFSKSWNGRILISWNLIVDTFFCTKIKKFTIVDFFSLDTYSDPMWQFCSSLPFGFPRIVFAPKALRPWKCPKHDQIVESPDTLHCTVAPWSLLLHLKHSRAESRKFAYWSDHQTSQNQNKRWNRYYLLSSCKSCQEAFKLLSLTPRTSLML